MCWLACSLGCGHNYTKHPEKLFDIMNRINRGVWCGGVSEILAYLYDELGYRTYVYSFGRPGGLTHAVTLVKLNKKIYLEDAYFNYSFVNNQYKPLYFF